MADDADAHSPDDEDIAARERTTFPLTAAWPASEGPLTRTLRETQML